LTPIGPRATASAAVWRRLKVTTVGVVEIDVRVRRRRVVARAETAEKGRAPAIGLEARGKLSEAETPRR